MDTSDLRVAVLVNESRSISNRLWNATRANVGELLIVGPADTTEMLPPGQLVLPNTGPRREKLTFWHLRGLKAVLDGFRPDLIHVNNELWAVTCLELMTRREPFTVLGAENLFHHEGLVPQIRMRLADRVISRIAGYGSWNQAGVDHVAARREPGFPTIVCPAIIPPGEFVPGSWRQPAPDLPRDILLIGRLTAEKGFDKVIDAIALLPDRDRYRIHLCGTGANAGQLQRQAQARRVTLVSHGFVASQEVAELMRTMTCLIQPSQTVANWAEQFGRTVAEAMTVGLPCLVSDSGELPNVVADPQCVFAEADVSALAERIQWLCGDPAILQEQSRRQAESARRWAPENAARAITDFWGAAATAGR